MRSRPWITAISLLAIGSAVGGPAGARSEVDDTDPGLVDGPRVWLEGPFGRVAGGSLERPAAAPPDGTPLDTIVLDAPLTIETDAPFEDVVSVHVAARASDGDGADEMLSDGTTTFGGPSDPGEAVIVATLETDLEGTVQRAWLVSVPDQENTPDALFELDAPDVELISDAGIVAGVPGDGCYVYFCADVGERPPPDTLEPLRVGVGETLAVRTVDGSGLAGWNGMLSPLAGTGIDSITAVGALTDTVESTLPLMGLEAPSRGQWLLEVRVVFDRERGHQWQAYRLDVR